MPVMMDPNGKGGRCRRLGLGVGGTGARGRRGHGLAPMPTFTVVAARYLGNSHEGLENATS